MYKFHIVVPFYNAENFIEKIKISDKKQKNNKYILSSLTELFLSLLHSLQPLSYPLARYFSLFGL